MTLREARCVFTRALAELVLYANDHGYQVAFGEGMDRLTAKDPTSDHMPGSLHETGLAQDIDLYKDGAYCLQTEDHRPIGEWWEAHGKELGVPLAWGGRFKDGNHYSLAWQGKK